MNAKKGCLEEILEILDQIYVVGNPQETYLLLIKKINLILKTIEREN
jgi:hypothetical protein